MEQLEQLKESIHDQGSSTGNRNMVKNERAPSERKNSLCNQLGSNIDPIRITKIEGQLQSLDAKIESVDDRVDELSNQFKK